MNDPNIKVILDLKAEFPNVTNEEFITRELSKELEICKKYLLAKLNELVEKSNKVKIYQESA